jgi:hypothetical protein
VRRKRARRRELAGIAQAAHLAQCGDFI